MTEPRDEIAQWLDAPVEPLPPPPGTLERIRRRARRHRRNQAMAATATAIAVVAGLAAAPRLVSLVQAGSGQTRAVTNLQSAAGHNVAQPNTRFRRMSANPTVAGTGQPLLNGFAPISATFVGLKTGWALGTLAGPCSTTSGGCLALARTDNTGASWYSVPAPPTGLASNGAGVSQVRFLNRDDGWVFGPELWWTRDGGQTWQQVHTGGEHVISLEAVGDRAFAVFARCSGDPRSTSDGGSTGCSSYQLTSAVAGTGAWQPVPGATSGSGTASVVLAPRAGYLIASSQTAVRLSRGPVTGAGAWSAVSPPCMLGLPPATPAQKTQPGAAIPGGAALLATADSDRLFAVCAPAGGGATGATASPAPERAMEIVTSTDGGRTWTQSAAATAITGTARSAAAAPGAGTLLLAASTGLYVSSDGGTTWRLVLRGPPGGFDYAGMTGVLQGFAIPAAHITEGVLFTTDGGQSWRWSAVSAPG